MKENIDLTIDRAFPDTRTRAIPQISTWVVNSRDVSIFPWDLWEITSDLDIDDARYSDDDIFPTGTKAQRSHKKSVNIACSSEHCDRCGKVIYRYPWAKFSSLCYGCEKALNIEFAHKHNKQIPWKTDGLITISEV